MGLTLREIDNITELKSEVMYIKKFIGRFTIDDSPRVHVFYAYFSIEQLPIGDPRIEIKHIDVPAPALIAAEPYLKERIVSLRREGKIKQSLFTGL